MNSNFVFNSPFSIFNFYLHFRHFLRFETGKPKFFHNLSTDQIDSVAAEGIILYGFRKMDRIEELPFNIDEGAEVHPLLFNGTYILDGDEESEHAYLFPDVVHHIASQDISPEAGFEQVEPGMGHRPSEEFDLVVDLTQRGAFEGGNLSACPLVDYPSPTLPKKGGSLSACPLVRLSACPLAY